MLAIGCYGGEHVGDAAILGGVIRRFATPQRVVVASFRPYRTRRWCRTLGDLPTHISVIDSATLSLARAVKRSDGVVHAGGPLMDLPDMLARSLLALSIARLTGRPASIEGAGLGPFSRSASLYLARRLIRVADQITLRETRPLVDPVLESLAELAGTTSDRPDPAFDHIAGLLARSDRPVRVDQVRGATTIGLNLRPLWTRHLAAGAVHGSELEAIQRGLFDAIAEFGESVRAKVRWRLFAMNADEYGFSDFGPLSMASETLEARSCDVDLIYREHSIDEALAVVHSCDLVVAMRFHAAVFALASGRPTLGIDYSDTAHGKMSRLLDSPVGYNPSLSVGAIPVRRVTSTVLGERLSPYLEV